MNNLYRVFWLDGTQLRHAIVEAVDIINAIQCGFTPSGGHHEYVTTSNGTVNGNPIVKVELLLGFNDETV